MAKMRSEQIAWPPVLIGAVVFMIALIIYLGLADGAQIQRPGGLNLSPPPLPDVELPSAPPKLPTG